MECLWECEAPKKSGPFRTLAASTHPIVQVKQKTKRKGGNMKLLSQEGSASNFSLVSVGEVVSLQRELG